MAEDDNKPRQPDREQEQRRDWNQEVREARYRRRQKSLAEEAGKKAARKLRARRTRDESLWYGLGMFGMVGWTVAIPTVIGAGIGFWIDAETSTRHSWTLMLMFAGLVIGGLSAWFWIKRESKGE